MDMTKKLTKDLIEMYWERKCLWQINSKEYKNRDMKKKAYQEIVMFLRRNGVKEANATLVRDKIQNLRRAMRKEKKRIDNSGGACSPILWYYDLLIFVNDQHEDTSSITSSSKYVGEKDEREVICADTDEDLFHNDDEEIIDETNEVLQAVTSKKRIKDENKKYKVTKRRKKQDIGEKESSNGGLGNTTEFEAVGINFTAKLKRMEPKQQIFAELLIQKVLARGLLGELNKTTDVVDRL